MIIPDGFGSTRGSGSRAGFESKVDPDPHDFNSNSFGCDSRSRSGSSKKRNFVTPLLFTIFPTSFGEKKALRKTKTNQSLHLFRERRIQFLRVESATMGWRGDRSSTTCPRTRTTLAPTASSPQNTRAVLHATVRLCMRKEDISSVHCVTMLQSQGKIT